MAVITVNAKDFPDLFAKNEKDRIRRAELAAVEAAHIGAGILAAAAPHDTGELSRSVNVVSTGKSAAAIHIDSPHAEMVEMGSRPHRPPMAPLFAWAARHGLDEGVAWAIAKKIETEGTKPTFFVRDSMKELTQIFFQIILRKMED